jgi:hypothetical protein
MAPELAEVLARLERWGAERDWIGADPYEGLNSALGRLAPTRRTRQAVTQLYKRLRIQPREPLRAPLRPNAKALALVLSGYATAAGRRLPGADRYLVEIPRRLAEMNLLKGAAGWGYHFDVQTRNLAYDSRTPNAIATCFVVGALCDVHEGTGERAARDLALAARPFLLSLFTDSEHGPFFSYVPGGSPLIHNANLLVCGALARLHRLDPDREAEDEIRRAAATTLARQRKDGLWPYGEEANYAWVDNFHTVYLLDGLWRTSSTFGLGERAFKRGFEAWNHCFFEPDGWARYFPERHFPLETHCCASAIDLLSLIEGHDHRELARRIAGSAVRELWLEEPGRFAFRRTRTGLNRRGFVRWTNAPMFRSLAIFLSSDEG